MAGKIAGFPGLRQVRVQASRAMAGKRAGIPGYGRCERAGCPGLWQIREQGVPDYGM